MECRKESVKKDGYTVILNRILQDETISLKAKGLYCFMQSKPDGWGFNVAGLATQNRDGKDAVCSALQELKKAGYLRMEKRRDESGKFSFVSYLLYDVPYSENPETGKPDAENPEVINKDYSNPPIVPQKGIGVQIS